MNTSGSAAEIMKWKKSSAVARCFAQLFASNYAALIEIVDKVFGGKDYGNLQMAYVIAICTTLLDPKNNRIKCRENSMKKKIDYYFVSFAEDGNLAWCEKLL